MKISKIASSLVLLVMTTIFLLGCRMSTSQLTKKVEQSMVKKFSENRVRITIKSLVLTEKGGNEYSGILETSEPNGNFTYSVIVDYDGNNMTWKVQPL